MRTTHILCAIVVVLSVVPGLVVADAVGNPELDAAFVDNSVTPGEDTNLQLQVINSGNIEEGSETNPQRDDRVKSARGLTVSIRDESVPIDVNTGTQAVGTLPEGATSLSVPISVDEDARPGEYTVDVVVDYTYTREIDDNGDETTRDVRRTIPVTLRVEEGARFEVVGVDSDVRVGDTGTVSVTMRNEGTITVTDARATLSSTSPVMNFAGSESASRFIGPWEPGENQTVEYDLTATDDAETRSYSFEATVEYRDEDGDSATAEARPLGVTPGPERTFEITDTNDSLAVGSEGRLTGTVNNTGEAAYNSASIVYTGSAETVTAIESEVAIGSLEPGESAQFSLPFEISSSAEAGPRQLPVTVQYRNDDGEQVRTESVDLRAEVGPDDPEFDLEVQNATVTAGDGTQLRVSVTNNEDETLRAISAKLFAEDPLSTADDEAFISELEPGESETVLFDISAGAGALAKSYPLSMDFQYDDSDGDTLTSDTYRLGLQVSESEDGGGFPVLLILAVLGLVVLGAAAYYRTRG